MREAIYAALKPVRARQQRLFALRCAAAGLVAGGVGAAAVGVARLALGLELTPWIGAAVLAAGPTLGLLVGFALRRSWHGAAEAVDSHYGLKDRTVTALAFANQQTPTDLHTLQLADAAAHLGSIQPKAVVPATAPKAW